MSFFFLCFLAIYYLIYTDLPLSSTLILNVSINYTNEALQQQFNNFVLKVEQEEYKREGIKWAFVDFPDNQDCLDLIGKRGSGIIPILDDMCKAVGMTDRCVCLHHGGFVSFRSSSFLF